MTTETAIQLLTIVEVGALILLALTASLIAHYSLQVPDAD
jgi:hypothetical protein